MASSSSSLDPKTLNSKPSKTPNLPPPPKPSNPPPLFPLSSRRGFVPNAYRSPQSTDQLVTVAANSSGGGVGFSQFANKARPFGVTSGASTTPSNSQQTTMRPPPPPSPSPFGGQRFLGGIKKTTNPSVKTAPFQSPATGNGYRDSRDRNREATVVTINHRKVTLSDGASLYALCRSWVRNGLPQENQAQFGGGLKLLPRPLPVNVTNTRRAEINGIGDKDEVKEEDGSAVENSSARELLQMHVRHAKKVRARLRKERLQRIERYKQRLALLLPSPVEEFRRDTTTEHLL